MLALFQFFQSVETQNQPDRFHCFPYWGYCLCNPHFVQNHADYSSWSNFFVSFPTVGESMMIAFSIPILSFSIIPDCRWLTIGVIICFKSLEYFFALTYRVCSRLSGKVDLEYLMLFLDIWLSYWRCFLVLIIRNVYFFFSFFSYCRLFPDGRDFFGLVTCPWVSIKMWWAGHLPLVSIKMWRAGTGHLG